MGSYSKQFFKFPRTHHLAVVGKGSGITRDDLVSDAKSIKKLYFNGDTTVSIEEKIDGANIGISIHESGKLVAQNRSHFVTSASSSQFGQLQQWIDDHSSELWSICAPNENHGPRILFGEWLAAQHTVAYDDLPDFFIAFDIYDIETKSFVSRELRHSILQETSIAEIHTISSQKFTSVDQVITLLKECYSHYSTKKVKVEGFYLRIDDNGVNIHRGKIVQGDFIQSLSDGHWSKKKMVKNRINYEAYYALQSRNS